MKARATIKFKNFNGQRFARSYNETLDIQMRQAARAWLRAVLTRVPVFTGMARGSLIPLGQFLRVAIPINRNPNANKHGHQLRSQADGIPLGKFKFEHLKTLLRFSFSTLVEHYIINEQNNPNPPIHLIHEAPWYSFEAGKLAFNQYMKENLKQKLPKLKDYVENFEEEYS